AEDAAPFADRTVARDEQAPALVAARDELEEEMRSLGLEREVAELVDDQKLRLGPVREPLLEPALELGLAELGHQRVRRHEQHAVAGADHFAAKRDGKMRLADAGRAEEQERVAVGNEAPRGKLPQLLRVERWLRVEVEARELAHERELRDRQMHLDPALVLARDLALAEERQCLAEREIEAARLVEEPIELIANGGELQPRQHARERVDDCFHHQLPPASCSYSTSGRRSAGAIGSLPRTSRRTGVRKPATPSKCAGSTTRWWRSPRHSAWSAISRPAAHASAARPGVRRLASLVATIRPSSRSASIRRRRSASVTRDRVARSSGTLRWPDGEIRPTSVRSQAHVESAHGAPPHP